MRVPDPGRRQQHHHGSGRRPLAIAASESREAVECVACAGAASEEVPVDGNRGRRVRGCPELQRQPATLTLRRGRSPCVTSWWTRLMTPSKATHFCCTRPGRPSPPSSFGRGRYHFPDLHDGRASSHCCRKPSGSLRAGVDPAVLHPRQMSEDCRRCAETLARMEGALEERDRAMWSWRAPQPEFAFAGEALIPGASLSRERFWPA
jgi:hypothetical protein